MSKQTFIPVFNNNLLTFLNTLSSTFPNEVHFKKASVAVSSVILLDKEIPLLQFRHHVNPHRDQIMNCDDLFFLNKDAASFVESNDSGKATDIIDYLKNLWKGISDINKKVIWNWLHALIKISDQCV